MNKIFTIFLLIGVIALGAQWKLEHDAAEEAKTAQSQAEDQLKQVKIDMAKQTDKMGEQVSQVNQLKDQISQLNAQLAEQKQQQETIAHNAAVQAAANAKQANPTEMLSDNSGALVIIEGKNSVGSGFICTMDGHTYVITNAHVLAANPTFKITSVKGVVYTPAASGIAVGHDLVRMEVTTTAKPLDLADNPNNVAKIGDPIIIPGNTGGAGVVTSTAGKIVGIGPDLIEIDAPIVAGNSGSPIIHQASGKVLGVATYSTIRKVSDNAQGTVKSEVRRFGYRLDGISSWEPINWQSFYSQAAQLDAIETLSQDFIKMFGDSYKGMDFDPNKYASPAIQRPLKDFVAAAKMSGKTMSLADKKQLVGRLIGELQSVSHSDIIAFSRVQAYDYFRQEANDQGKFRQELYDGLSKAMQNLQ